MQTPSFSGIYFVPVGGLGNRMRAMSSAIRLAEDHKVKLTIGWYQDWGMGCKFADIFEPLTCEVRDEKRWAYYLLDRPRKKNLFLPRLYEQWQFDKCIYEDVLGYTEVDFSFLSNVHNAWMASCKAFYREQDISLSFFRPVASLRNAIDRATADFPSRVVGMHIRRTDHQQSISQSPTDAFQKVIDHLDDDISVYLASDDEREKQDLKSRYGNRLITRNGLLGRGSKVGIQNAVIDMYILSATERIYGSKGSSFGQMAALIGNKELIEVTT